MKDFVITTDSNSDLPKEYLKENKIDIISHYYEMDGEVYGEDHLLTDKDFYDRMRNGSMPITMASNPAAIREVFLRHVEEGHDILHISFSSALSCGCSNVTMEAAEMKESHPEAKIIVLDSLNVSLGQGLMILCAVNMKAAGKSMEEIVEWLEENKLHFCVQFTVDDLFHLHRGGRVSKATAIVGTLINVKPILYVNPEGGLVSLHNTRGRKKALASIVDNMIERMGKYKDDKSCPICIVHGDAGKDAEYVADLVRAKLNRDDFIINTVSPSIGAHSGPSAIGLCFLGEDR